MTGDGASAADDDADVVDCPHAVDDADAIIEKNCCANAVLSFSGPLGNMSLDQEEQLQRKLSNWRAGFSKEKSKMDKQKDRADALNEAMQQIREVTGLNGIDEFIDRFLHFEESNFRAFETHNLLLAGRSHELSNAAHVFICGDIALCFRQT